MVELSQLSPSQPAVRSEPGDIASAECLHKRLSQVRKATEALVAALSAEDQNLQSMPEVSPAKWHRAHTSWFFETFVLEPHLPGYQVFHPAFAELFNSYYNGVGRQHPRPYRALLSRPSADEVGDYRRHVDEALARLVDCVEESAIRSLIELGIAHEQQHQELILTDLKHGFSFNPLAPALGAGAPDPSGAAPKAGWVRFEAGDAEIGADGGSFCFDNERPRHRVIINAAFELADRPVTCGDYAEFIADGGYRQPLLWLSDGWAWVEREGIEAPLYWQREQQQWNVRTLAGMQPLDPAEPVCHLSFYEAAAFAEWANARLPTEAEWEQAAARYPVEGQFADTGRYHPAPVEATARAALRQIFGGVWEWTASAYAPYPGFSPAGGAIGEYNGKFMANQMVLRGGSCVTPPDHVRPSYRNFFYPADRWQFSGVRLARDV